MKKLLFIVSILFISFFTIACDGVIDTDDLTLPTTEVPTTQVPTTTEDPAIKASEITLLKAALLSSGMTVQDDDAFVNELYDNGMKSTDLSSMVTSMNTLMASAASTEFDLSETYLILDQAMEDMDRNMVKALLSSIIKIELKASLQAQILEYEAMTEGDYTEDIAMLNDLIAFIDSKGDEAVDSVMVVINYIMDVQAAIETTLIDDVETLMNAEEISPIQLQLMVAVKNGFVGYLKSELPDLADFVLLNSTIYALVDVMTEEDIDFSIMTIQKQSQQVKISIELFFELLLDIDEDFMTALVDSSSEMSQAQDQKELLKEMLLLVDGFLEDNDVKIQSLNNIYTDQEKETIFFDVYVDQLLRLVFVNSGETDITDDVISAIDEMIDFSQLLALETLAGDTFNDLLDAVIDSDFAIIEAVVNSSMMSYDDYETPLAFEIAKGEADHQITLELLALLNPILQSMTLEEYELSLDIFFSGLGLMLEINDLQTLESMADEIMLISLIEVAVADTSQAQLDMMKSIMNILATENYLIDYHSLAKVDPETGQPISVKGSELVLANLYIDVYAAIEDDLETLYDRMLVLVNLDGFKAKADILQEDIDNITYIHDVLLVDAYAQAMVIKDYDHLTLTSQEELEIQTFLDIFASEGTPQ